MVHWTGHSETPLYHCMKDKSSSSYHFDLTDLLKVYLLRGNI